MAGYYIYLISSLAMLHFGMKPPFSFENFLRRCEGLIPESDIDILRSAYGIEEYGFETSCPALRKWRAFDITLRNELVKVRAVRRKVEPDKFMRCGGYTDSYIAHIALHAYRAPSILEAEQILDRERWRFLDELSVGHYFDIDTLVIYAIKLLILERWHRINTADKTQVLEACLQNA